jgi:pimeloyl-ACP methyl ester carboxylesterase
VPCTADFGSWGSSGAGNAGAGAWGRTPATPVLGPADRLGGPCVVPLLLGAVRRWSLLRRGQPTFIIGGDPDGTTPPQLQLQYLARCRKAIDLKGAVFPRLAVFHLLFFVGPRQQGDKRGNNSWNDGSDEKPFESHC